MISSSLSPSPLLAPKEYSSLGYAFRTDAYPVSLYDIRRLLLGLRNVREHVLYMDIHKNYRPVFTAIDALS